MFLTNRWHNLSNRRYFYALFESLSLIVFPPWEATAIGGESRSPDQQVTQLKHCNLIRWQALIGLPKHLLKPHSYKSIVFNWEFMAYANSNKVDNMIFSDTAIVFRDIIIWFVIMDLRRFSHIAAWRRKEEVGLRWKFC